MKYDFIKYRFEENKKLNNHEIRLIISLFFRKGVMTRDAGVILLLMSIRVAGLTTFMMI